MDKIILSMIMCGALIAMVKYINEKEDNIVEIITTLMLSILCVAYFIWGLIG